MNKKLKYVSLVAILALFMVALAPNYIGYAEASSAEWSPNIITNATKKLISDDESKIIPIIVIGIERWWIQQPGNVTGVI